MSNKDATTVGELVRAMRKRQGLSQQQLADFIGVSKTSVFLYENGQNLPKPDTSKRLAEYFGLPIEKFQAGSDNAVEESDLARLARLAGVSEDRLLSVLVGKYGLSVAADLAASNGITELRLRINEDGTPSTQPVPMRKLRPDEFPNFSNRTKRNPKHEGGTPESTNSIPSDQAAAQGQKDGLASPVPAGKTVPIPETIPKAAEALIRVSAAKAKKPKVGI